MEENNKLQQNHSGNTPPPVPQLSLIHIDAADD